MTFTKIQSISYPGIRVNEDIAYAGDRFAWVIDGSTGLNKKCFTKDETDAHWFVKEWNAYLLGAMKDPSKNLCEIFTEGIEIIKAKFFDLVNGMKVGKLDFPSAAVAALQIVDGGLEYFVLGDCSLLYQKDGGEVVKMKDKRVERFDDEAIELIRTLMAKGDSFKDAREKANDLLISNRLLKNTDEGYWALEFDQSAVQRAIYGKIENFSKIKILLASDGFTAVSDTYELLNAEQLLEAIEQRGLNYVYEMIRTTEDNDPECVRYPRFKKSDDTSAVYAEI
ncbi:MAG: hypothetical protein N2645_12920 [Clostridia bacterium]|nr:hypothetical protein [Clostridia bacterium]